MVWPPDEGAPAHPRTGRRFVLLFVGGFLAGWVLDWATAFLPGRSIAHSLVYSIVILLLGGSLLLFRRYELYPAAVGVAAAVGVNWLLTLLILSWSDRADAIRVTVLAAL